MHFYETEFKFGAGPYAGRGFFYRKGQGYDNNGSVIFEIGGSFKSASFDPKDSNYSLLGDVGLELGFHWDWTSDTFLESIEKFTNNISATVFDITTIGDKRLEGLSLSGGASYGVGLSSLAVNRVRALLFTQDELAVYTNGASFSDWRAVNNKLEISIVDEWIKTDIILNREKRLKGDEIWKTDGYIQNEIE